MSVDEDTELKDLIAQTLEANGCFAKIRAQMRASIYLALEENESLQKKQPMLNNKIKTALGTPDGRIMFQIVRDFLEFYDLHFTLSVYDSESNLGTFYEEITNKSVMDDLNIPNFDDCSPILLQLIKLTRSGDIDKAKEDSNLKIEESNIKNGVSSLKNGDTSFKNGDSSLKNDDSNLKNDDSNLKNITLENVTVERNKNETFEVNSPMFAGEKEIISEKSISENILSDKSIEFEISAKSIDGISGSDLEVSPPIVKDGKHSKLSLYKLDKSLPPINAKSRANEMLLPPLYSKEMKDISSQRELEKMFDLEPLDNYEEDFMSESEMDFGNVKMKSFENNSASTLEGIKNKKRVDAENQGEGILNTAKSDTDNV